MSVCVRLFICLAYAEIQYAADTRNSFNQTEYCNHKTIFISQNEWVLKNVELFESGLLSVSETLILICFDIIYLLLRNTLNSFMWHKSHANRIHCSKPDENSYVITFVIAIKAQRVVVVVVVFDDCIGAFP